MGSLSREKKFRFLLASVAIILLVAVIPVMWYNLKTFMQQEVF